MQRNERGGSILSTEFKEAADDVVMLVGNTETIRHGKCLQPRQLRRHHRRTPRLEQLDDSVISQPITGEEFDMP